MLVTLVSETAAAPPSARPATDVPAVAFDRVSFAFDDQVVLDNISFAVPRGSMRILLGASGSGKSVLLKLILGLLKPDSGTVSVDGLDIGRLRERELMHVRTDIGMLFQEGALFDSLTVEENVGYRLYEETAMPAAQARRQVEDVLGFMGLGDYLDRMPAELSGGQRRRVAIARAMAAKPSLLLLDDPTSGLDPLTATTVDDEIVKLRDLERVTALMATHQIRDAFYIATHRAFRENGKLQIVPSASENAIDARFMVLHGGRIYFEGTASALQGSRDPYLRQFLFMTLPPW